MTAPPSAKQEIHQLVEAMSEAEAEDLLDYLNMLSDPDELTPEELADVRAIKARMDAGDFATAEEIKAEFGRLA